MFLQEASGVAPSDWIQNMFGRLQRAMNKQFGRLAARSAPSSPAEDGNREARDAQPPVPTYVRLLQNSESLGDNCEFGFFQRFDNCEPSSLFRWAVTPIDRLIQFLQTPAEMFLDADLQCVESDLVFDKGSGFYFHSDLIKKHEGGRELVSDPIEFSTIYPREKQKIDHLKSKFFQRLAGPPRLYVIKANAGIQDDDLFALARELRRYNSSHLLLHVTATSEFALVRKGDGVFEGGIGWLAPYHAANKIDLEGWRRLFVVLSREMEIRALIEETAV
jgi:hypothetical protein